MSMLHIRERNTSQNREMIEVSASGVDFPLQLDWNQRYCTLPKRLQNKLEEIISFPVECDDVFLITMPRSGTTWIQEAAWLILNDLDYEKSATMPLFRRSPFIEFGGLFENVSVDTIQMAIDLPSPRLIKSHLPANLLPREVWTKKVKIITIARNPKDVIVSYFHFLCGIGKWSGSSLEKFVVEFLDNDIMFTPYWPAVLDFWQMRNESNIFFTTFEAMKKDLPGVLRKLTAFLEKPELSDVEISKLVDHLSFEQMKADPMINRTEDIKRKLGPSVQHDFEFIRRGVVGSYKDELTEKCVRDIDEWTKRYLEPLHLTEDDIFS